LEKLLNLFGIIFRAFAGATVHDLFNLLSVVVLLPLEVITKMFERMTGTIMDSLLQNYTAEHTKPPDMLKVNVLFQNWNALFAS